MYEKIIQKYSKQWDYDSTSLIKNFCNLADKIVKENNIKNLDVFRTEFICTFLKLPYLYVMDKVLNEICDQYLLEYCFHYFCKNAIQYQRTTYVHKFMQGLRILLPSKHWLFKPNNSIIVDDRSVCIPYYIKCFKDNTSREFFTTLAYLVFNYEHRNDIHYKTFDLYINLYIQYQYETPFLTWHYHLLNLYLSRIDKLVLIQFIKTTYSAIYSISDGINTDSDVYNDLQMILHKLDDDTRNIIQSFIVLFELR